MLRSDNLIDLKSVWRGICAMTPGHQINWAVRQIPRWRLWLHFWTPIWHDGRGPYLSVGFGFFAIYRGY